MKSRSNPPQEPGEDIGLDLSPRKKRAAENDDKPKDGGLVVTPKQVEFLEAVLDGRYRILGMGGGIRGTKTFAVLIVITILCRMFPGSRWAIVRKDMPTLRRNTIPSYNKLRGWAPNFLGKINQSTWTATCSNGSEIVFFPESLQEDPEMNRWRGLEVNGFALDESNELQKVSYEKAIERRGSWIIPRTPKNPNPIQPPRVIMCTFNPCNNWPREIFYDPWKNGTIQEPFFFLPATILDNPHASEEYRESLKDMDPTVYRKFVGGEWDEADEPNQLIKLEWILNAQNIDPDPDDTYRGIGADIARFGNDQTVFCHRRGNALSHFEEFQKQSTVRTSKLLLAHIDNPVWPVPAENVIIDTVGLGGGVLDNLVDWGKPVREFIAGAAAVYRKGSHFRYFDLRSQAWWEFAQKLRKGLISLPQDLPQRFINDLTSIHYDISGEKVIRVESKKDLKDPKRLGRSTDHGDAAVMAFFDMPPRRKRAMLAPSMSLNSLS